MQAEKEQELIDRMFEIRQSGTEKDVDFVVDILYSGDSKAIREMAIDTLIELGRKYDISEKIAELLRSDDAFTRNAAIEILAETRSKKILKKLLSDPDKEVRKYALDALGRMNEEDVGEIISKALDDPDPNVKFAACEYIGKLNYKKAEDKLIDMLKKEESEYGISVLLDTLVKLKSEKALPHIKQKYEKYRNTEIAISFFKAISSIEGKLMCGELLNFLNHYYDVIEVLAGVPEINCREEVEEYISQLSDDKVYAFAEEIITIAGKIKSRKILEKVALALPSDETIYPLFDVFEEVCMQIGLSENVLLRMLDEGFVKKLLGIRCAKFVQSERVAEKLVELLTKESNEDVSLECASAISRFPAEKIPSSLLKEIFPHLGDEEKVLLLSPETAKVLGKEILEKELTNSQNMKLKYKILKVSPPPSPEKLREIIQKEGEPLRTLARRILEKLEAKNQDGMKLGEPARNGGEISNGSSRKK